MKKRLLTIIGVILMAAALFTVAHFIWSDLYIAEFDADDAEVAIWAQSTLESGHLLDPDYRYYGVLLPVAGNLFLAPFVKAFGVGITALRAGYTVLAVVFAALLVLALRVCLPSWDLALIGGGLIMIFTTATETVRDIYWLNLVYYNLSSFAVLMCIGSLGLYLRGKRVLGGILFFLGALLGSINGNAVLLYTALSLAAALFLEPLIREHSGEGFVKGPLLLICAAIVCGVGLNTAITAGIEIPYADNYMQIASASQWLENLSLLPERWLSLFFDLPEESVPVMSSVGIKLALRLGTALVLSVLPIFSFFALQDTESRLTRIVILYHWILCAVLLFLFVFGTISNYSRRLIPLWFSCLIVDWLMMMWMLKERGYWLIAGAASVCLTVLLAGMAAVSVTRQPADVSIWYGDGAVYNILETNGLTHGYSTNFWYAGSVTVLSESRINSLGITVTDDGFEIPEHQAKSAWYEGAPSEEKTFLVCLERELFQHPWLEDDAVEVFRATQYTPVYDMTEGYFILVYDRDVIAEKLQKSVAANVGTQEN